MIIFALLIGIIAGLRALTPLAVISWAAQFGWLQLQDTWLAFLGFAATAYIATALALGELVTDKLPRTPSRKVPMQFGARIVVGALCGAVLGTEAGAMPGGLFAGVVGGVVGTLGGAALRAQLARLFGKDLPAALIEDVVAIGGALLIVSRFA
jgi:uncharacterized membrane protein